jgi:thiamine-monophosphate kinase
MSSGEDDLIARYFTPLATDPGALGLVDDAAILKGLADDLVVTTDAIVEGVHFLPDDPPDTIARKALRVNLSDLAAKGASPAGFVLTLALREAKESWLAPFARALGEDATAFACPLLGGDTVSTPGPLTVSITAFGRVPVGRMVRRSGAQPDDVVVVTGTIGDATAKLCKASGVSAQVELDKIPVSPQARALLGAGAATIETLIAGGDDYEVLCTVPEGRLAAFLAAAKAAAVPATAIGVIRGGAVPPRFVAGDGREVTLTRSSYSHF